MKKVAIIGQKSNISIFTAVGCEIFIVKNKKDAVQTLNMLIEKKFALIFITNSLAEQIPKTIKKYSLGFAPIISKIPG